MDLLNQLRIYLPPSWEEYTEEIIDLVGKHKVLTTTTCILILLYIRRRYVAERDAIEYVTKEPMSSTEEYNGMELPATKQKNVVFKSWFKMWFVRMLYKSPLRQRLASEFLRKSNIQTQSHCIVPEKPTYKPIVFPDDTLRGKTPIADGELWNYVKPRKVKDEFEFMTISSLLQAYKSGKTTPTDVAKRIIAALKQMENDGKELRAVIEYYEELILEAAEASTKRWEMKKPLSVFDGIPVAVKDQYFLNGHHARCGTEMPEFDEPKGITDEDGMVNKLRRGGAVFIGITNMHQLGVGLTGINPSKYHGTSLNPYNLQHCTGGSSGGSAATVASGLCPVALGTDAGGSIRSPAAICGVVGLKGTFDRFITTGALIGATTLGHAGPLCATVRDAAITYGFLANKDGNTTVNPFVSLGEFENRSFEGLRIGVDWQWIVEADEEIKNGCCTVIKGLKEFGATIVDVKIPEKEEMYTAHKAIVGSEFADASKLKLIKHEELLNFDSFLVLTLGSYITSSDYIRSARQRTRLMISLKYIFSKADILLTPAFCKFAPMVDENLKRTGLFDIDIITSMTRTMGLGNLSGIPGITLPIAYSENNLPIAMQLYAPWWREDILLRAACGIEKHVKKKRPSYYFDILQY